MSVTPESIQELINSSDYGERLQGINQLRQLEPATAFKLIQPLVKDQNARVRYSAVSLFDTIGQQDLVISSELLRERLQEDTEIDVKSAAADAIAALKITDAFAELQQAYHETTEWLLQFSIIAALGEMGHPESFDLLQEALNADNVLIQTAAIGALGDLGDSRAVAKLVSFVDNEDWQIRDRLAKSLGKLGGTEAKSALEQLAQDEVAQVAQEAKRSLAV